MTDTVDTLYVRYSNLARELEQANLAITAKPAEVRWDDIHELGTPVVALLSDLNLLEDPDPEKKVRIFRGTPPDKQAITAGVTTIVKYIAPTTGLAGAIGAGFAYVQGLAEGGPGGWVLLSCATILIAVTLVVLGWLVSADLSARAQASSSQYRARAEAAKALLSLEPWRHVVIDPQSLVLPTGAGAKVSANGGRAKR